jgi:hypothetical protein
MAAAVGLATRPEGYTDALRAREPPAVTSRRSGGLTVWLDRVRIYNTQTSGSVRAAASGRRRTGVPVVERHGIPVGDDGSFLEWQLDQLGTLSTPRGTPECAGPAALVLDDVAWSRRPEVWSDGTLTVAAGAVVGVIGPNDAGKTPVPVEHLHLYFISYTFFFFLPFFIHFYPTHSFLLYFPILTYLFLTYLHSGLNFPWSTLLTYWLFLRDS